MSPGHWTSPGFSPLRCLLRDRAVHVRSLRADRFTQLMPMTYSIQVSQVTMTRVPNCANAHMNSASSWAWRWQPPDSFWPSSASV